MRSAPKFLGQDEHLARIEYDSGTALTHSASGDAQANDANKTDTSQSTDDKKDSKKESSSKKKKGLKKVLPW